MSRLEEGGVKAKRPPIRDEHSEGDACEWLRQRAENQPGQCVDGVGGAVRGEGVYKPRNFTRASFPVFPEPVFCTAPPHLPPPTPATPVPHPHLLCLPPPYSHTTGTRDSSVCHTTSKLTHLHCHPDICTVSIIIFCILTSITKVLSLLCMLSSLVKQV